jgi:transposase
MIPHDLEERIIRLHFVEKWTVGAIAKQLKVHRSTVKRALHQQDIAVAPSSRTSLIHPFLAFIQETLVQYPSLSASRLQAMVPARGFPVSASHFRHLVGTLRRRKPAEAFQRLTTLPGEDAQMDWGPFGSHVVRHAMRRLSTFVMVLSWSRMPFVHFFYDQCMGAFLDGHPRAFEALGDVQKRILYDNLKSAELERCDDAIRFNPNLLELTAYDRYEPRSVAMYRGDYKGRVERTIRYMRTSSMTARRWTDMGDLNRQAALWCRRETGNHTHHDQPELTVSQALCRRAIAPSSTADRRLCGLRRSDGSHWKDTIRWVGRNDYSVPHGRVRRQGEKRATSERMRIFDGIRCVAEHVRTFDKRTQIENPEHLEALREQKREAQRTPGMDRLRHEAPSSPILPQGAAERGHNLGSVVAGSCRLLDTWHAASLESAIAEAVAPDRLYVAAV